VTTVRAIAPLSRGGQFAAAGNRNRIA
jgi:hypothetical protein